MSATVVRRFASDTTHVMDVAVTSEAHAFGRSYRQPKDGPAACGVRINDGVVMRPGTRVRCRTCRRLTGMTEQPGGGDSVA